jgi:hypothetical protein
MFMKKQQIRRYKELLDYSAGLSVDGVLPRNIAGVDTPQVSVFRSHA